MDQYLYDIGLMIKPTMGNTANRSILHKPVFIFMFNFISVVQKFVLIKVEDSYLLCVLGDIGHHFKMKNYLNTLLIFLVMAILLSQLIYYYNYKKKIEPTFLKIFQDMSESRDIGVNSIDFNRLSHLSRVLFKLTYYNNMTFQPLFALLFFSSGYLIYESSIYIIIYGIPHSVISGLLIHYIWNILCFQCLYFYILCKYFKLKLQNLNQSLWQMSSGIKFTKIRQILHSFNALYREINEYNSTYWSKFLFVFLLVIGMAIVLFLHIILFKQILPIMLFILIHVTSVFIFIFMLILSMAASVNHEASRSYKLLNSFLLSPCLKSSKLTSNKIKVIIFI